MKQLILHKCLHCGNVALLLHDSGVPLVCCGEKMTILEAKSQDAGLEKHLPVVTHENGKLLVKCGSIPHPMSEEHYIDFLAVVSERGLEVIHLNKTGAAEALFNDVEHGIAYAYCNLHGLWKTEF